MPVVGLERIVTLDPKVLKVMELRPMVFVELEVVGTVEMRVVETVEKVEIEVEVVVVKLVELG